MILSRHDIQSADLSFQPPLTKMAANRKIFLIAAQGALLEGITYSKRKGGVILPAVLRITNRPELGGGPKGIEQPIDDMTRDVLLTRIREELNKGVPLWPNYHNGRR